MTLIPWIRVILRSIGVFAAASILGCTTSPPRDGPDVDAAADAVPGPPAPPQPMQPAPPSLADLGPCPDGWTPQMEGTRTLTCEPYPTEEPPTCEPGEAAFPGDASCAPLGDPCPESGFASDIVDDGTVIFVDAASTGGDGSMAMPHPRIADALAVAAPGDTVALAPGRYVEAVVAPTGVTVRGACASGTILEAPADAILPATFEAGGPDVVLRDVTVTGPGWGLLVRGDRGLTVRGVEVRDATTFGVVVADTGELRGMRLAIYDTAPASDGDLGVGLAAIQGSSATIDELIVSGNHTFGASASDPGSVLAVRDALAIDTQPNQLTDELGSGFVAANGASLTVERAYSLRSHAAGIVALVGSATLTDVVIRDTRLQRADGLGGMGISTIAGTVIGRRIRLDRNLCAAVAAVEGSTVELEQLRATRTGPGGTTSPLGTGLTAFSGATVTLRHASLLDNHVAGILAYEPGTTVDAFDVEIARTSPRTTDGIGGRALSVQLGARVTLSRAAIFDSSELAIAVLGAGAAIEMSDVDVRNTKSRPVDRGPGRGLDVSLGASATGQRLAFASNREATVFVHGDGSSATLSDLTIVDTLERECAVDDCAGSGAGMGVIALNGSSVDLSMFLIRDSALVGVQIAGGATVTARDGSIERNPIGVNVDDPDFDPSALSERVLFRDNGANLDSASLPLPDVVTDL